MAAEGCAYLYLLPSSPLVSCEVAARSSSSITGINPAEAVLAARRAGMRSSVPKERGFDGADLSLPWGRIAVAGRVRQRAVVVPKDSSDHARLGERHHTSLAIRQAGGGQAALRMTEAGESFGPAPTPVDLGRTSRSQPPGSVPREDIDHDPTTGERRVDFADPLNRTPMFALVGLSYTSFELS